MPLIHVNIFIITLQPIVLSFNEGKDDQIVKLSANYVALVTLFHRLETIVLTLYFFTEQFYP